MKKIIYIAFAAAALLAVSCQENYLGPEVPEVPVEGLTLSFTCGELATKADEVAGINNENLIKQIEYFFFPLNSEGKVADTTKFVYKGKLIPEDNGLAGTYTETVVPGLLTKIFPNGASEAVVFAVANYCTTASDGTVSVTDVPETALTWQDLHGLEVGKTFTEDGGPGYGLRWPRPMATDNDDLFFVMAADSVGVQLKTTGEYAINAEIPLERLASKVTVTFTYETVTDNKGVTWRPQPSDEETRVFLSNAICTTTLGGPLTRELNPDGGDEAAPSPNRDIFEYAYDRMKYIPEGQIPYYYTYPISMEAGDDNQPYIKLIMVWNGYKTIDGVETFYKSKEVYYKIALPRETITEPNRIYEYSVNVNILGSDKEVGIEGDYIVKDWLHGEPVSSSVATGRYISLEIPKDEYDMYVDSITISFVSSGTVVAKVDSIYQFNYSSASTSKDQFMRADQVVATQALRNAKGITNEDIQGWVSIPEGTSYLQIDHPMDNRMLINNSKNNAFDMAPYVFRVTLHLEEAGTDTSFDRTVIITQYPAMFVTSRHSGGYVYVNDYSYDDGTAYDNDRTGLGNISTSPGSLDGSTQSNSNPNNYIISTSILSDDSYIIADPRSRSVDNLSSLDLTNYHPTQATGTQSFIAPKFIVASSYGRISSYYYLTLANAEKRCAAYQENGYPAGRWRVPTYAEIKFMVTLSRMNFIPSLYNFSEGDTTGYWSANGKVIGDSNGLPELNTNYNNINTAVRCVYDAWYWGEEPVATGTDAQEWLGFYDNK